MSRGLDGLYCLACSGLRAGYPQAAPQRLGVRRPPFDDNLMTRPAPVSVAAAAGCDRSAGPPAPVPTPATVPVDRRLRQRLQVLVEK
ncbi:hypothetical protein C4K25_5298 [Pseudomonas chlororaphis]|nr:hypothetical protein C4K25_5298 [Pseudomonas chlororaphis]